MSDYVPNELVIEILKRLPAKNLLMFRCVSRSWYSLISTSEIISSHLHHNHNVGNYNLLLRRFCRIEAHEIYTIHDENPGHRIIKEQVFPFSKAQDDFFTIVGCVYGVICLWDGNPLLSHVILWNPAIRKCFRVPNLDDIAPNKEEFGCRKLSFGFGVDAITNEYKVLRLGFYFDDAIESRRVNRRPLSFYARKPYVCTADIFSMSSKSWRSITGSVPLEQLSIGIFLNGSLHWLTRKERENVWCIVSFSMHYEVFGEVAFPENVTLKVNLDHEIAVFDKYVSLLDQWTEFFYNVWVMKEYGVPSSWVKLFVIELDMFPGWKKILGFSWSKRLILVGSGHWTGYRIVQSVEFADFRFEGSYWAPHAEQYMESLVLLQDGENVPQLPENSVNIEQEDHERRGPRCNRVPGKRRRKRANVSII